MSIFPTSEEELENKIREKCYQEQTKLLAEISKDIDNRLLYLFYILLENNVSHGILKSAVNTVINLIKIGSKKEKLFKNFDEARQLLRKFFS